MEYHLEGQAESNLLSACEVMRITPEEYLTILVLTGTSGSAHPAVMAFWKRVGKGRLGTVNHGG